MYNLLSGLTIVEGASFIAGPSCALHLQQMGARIIRFDMIGGGPDYKRWPVTPKGDSLYWEGLNKGKQSIAVDLSRPEGRELATAIITAPGTGRGLFVTNYPAGGFLSHNRLAGRRADLITLRIMGWPDGRNGVDYTINAAVGVPFMTGGGGLAFDVPVNSVLPAWDLLAGAYSAFSLLAAERRRRETGQGGEICVALSDVAAGALGHLGQIAETMMSGDRPRSGNALFGAFGRDFDTRDKRKIMVVAITQRQWTGLITALGIVEEIASLEAELNVSFKTDEGQRYIHRERLFPVVERKVSAADFSELASRLDGEGVCWEPYRALGAAIADDERLVRSNDLFSDISHPSGMRYPTPGSFARLPHDDRDVPSPAPRLGEHTDEILADYLGLSESEIARLHDRGVVASAR
jgi:2-methylfumaryl-CoA isomerase